MKKFNLNQFIWFCILLALSLIMTYMFVSGKMFLLIDGDRKISTMMMIVILYLLTIVQVTRINTIPSRGGVKTGYIQYVALIAILIIVVFIDIPNTALNMKGVKLYHSEHKHGEYESHVHQKLSDNGELVVNSENFHNAIEEITAHMDKYIGKEIAIEGIYYNDEKYPNGFIITELNMNCCIADSDYLGILCSFNEIDSINIKNAESIKVKGKISSFYENDRKLIKIDVFEVIQYQKKGKSF